jgi:hypothetical protein
VNPLAPVGLAGSGREEGLATTDGVPAAVVAWAVAVSPKEATADPTNTATILVSIPVI